jgi:hypothetical protein
MELGIDACSAFVVKVKPHFMQPPAEKKDAERAAQGNYQTARPVLGKTSKFKRRVCRQPIA